MILAFVKRQSRDFKCPYVVKSLYCCLVRSILEYGAVVWSPWCKDDSNRIESVQKQFLLFALRHLNWAPRFELPPYDHRLQLISLEKLSLRRQVAKCVFIHDVLSGRVTAPHIKSLVVPRIPTRSTRLGDKFQVVQPSVSTNYEMAETLHSSIGLFNLVSQHHSPACSREVFKNHARLHICLKPS